MKKMLFLFLLSFSNFGFSSADLAKSEVKWEGSKKIGDKHVGDVKFKSIDLKMEKENVLKDSTFVVDMTSINVADLQGEWKQKLEGHLKNEDFFNVAKYPTAKFVVVSVDGNKITGNLTLKDKTNPITFEVKKDKKFMSGKLEIDRTKWGVVYNSNNYFKDLGDKIINDLIVLNISIALK